MRQLKNWLALLSLLVTAATALAGTPVTITGGTFPTVGTVGPIVNLPLPRTWRLQAVVTTGPITATAGVSVLN
jgi:hypothetical protein